jgi:hypothetical protein
MSEKQTSEELAKNFFETKLHPEYPRHLRMRYLAELLDKVRDEAIDECANVSDSYDTNQWAQGRCFACSTIVKDFIAKQIRKLKRG